MPRSTLKYSPPRELSECPVLGMFKRPQSKAGLLCEGRKRDALQMKPTFSRSPALRVPLNSRQYGGCGEARWSLYPHRDKVRWSGRMLALCKWIISPRRMGVGLIFVNEWYDVVHFYDLQERRIRTSAGWDEPVAQRCQAAGGGLDLVASGGGKLMSAVGEAQTFPLSVGEAMHVLGSAAPNAGAKEGGNQRRRPRRHSRTVVPSTCPQSQRSSGPGPVDSRPFPTSLQSLHNHKQS